MARSTSRDESVNADPGGQNVSTVPTIGSAQASSNAWLGISSRVEDGTTGSRPESSFAAYGGDRSEGELFKGTSANMPSSVLKEVNAQDSGERNSWNSMGQYGPGSPNYLVGGYGAREQMTIGGDENKGKYVGDGVNAIPDTDMTQYFISGKTPVQMPTNEYLAGTNEDRTRNMPVSEKGIGKRYPRNDAKNQYD